jgi:3',5'-cyclic AMP phosphodiesterase CpdA
VNRLDRRTFLRIVGASLGAGALYRVAPALASPGEGEEVSRALASRNGEPLRPFSFVQLSDTHVGSGPPMNPGGTSAFERAVEVVNRLPEQPELVLFTGDLIHDSEDPGEPARRVKRFKEIAGRLRVGVRKAVPGEHDAGLDGGVLFRESFGETHYSFDHRGVHFVALDNVSRALPEVGPDQLGWLRQDLSRFPPTAPIVLFTHRPLFDLRPDWEWFTSDGAEVTRTLARFENVTVLYGHIHREDVHQEGSVRHLAARSLAWAFPSPAAEEKKAVPFDPGHPYRNLGARVVGARPGAGPGTLTVGVDDVELTRAEYSGTEGFAQILRRSSLDAG